MQYMKSTKELAYRYDLYVVPYWREAFDQFILQHVAIPRTGSILTVNCGTGGLAIELAVKLGDRGDIIATDQAAERLRLARAKASMKQLNNIHFLEKDPTRLGMEEYAFELVIGDATLMAPESVEPMLAEMVRLTEDDGTVALTVLAQGSFGEMFSLLWEALYLCELTDFVPHVEALIKEYPTIDQLRRMMERQGIHRLRWFTERRELDFASGEEVFQSPLIEDYFLDRWLAFLPTEATRRRVIRKMIQIINREHRSSYFEVSVKATLLVGKKLSGDSFSSVPAG